MRIKLLGLAVCLAVISTKGRAQELGIEADEGLQGMHYRLSGGQGRPLPGGSLGLTYTFPLGGRLGFRTGIMGAIYRTRASLSNGATFTYDEVDDAGSAFEYDVKVTGYKETQQFFAAAIPLLLHYHSGGAGMQWYIEGGGKLVFPFNPGVRVSAQQLSLSGYYPDFHIHVSDLPQHGFGSVNGWTARTTTELKPSGALSAATGISFALSHSMRLYTGVYADYGLTDLKGKSDSLPLVPYNPGGVDKAQANGVLNMQHAAGAVTLLSFGVQLRLSFGSARPAGSARSQPAELTETQPAETVETKPAPSSTAKAAARPAAEATVQPKRVTVVPAESGKATTHRDVIFGIIGETNILETQVPKLDEVAGIMKQHPDLRVSIVGHFCDSLMETENAQVAEARAKAVANYLQNKGISRRRMDVTYERQSDPVLSYDPASNYRNRRVVIGIIGSF